MNLQTRMVSDDSNSNQSSRLEPMLVRLPPTLADQLRQLARETRIRQSDYLREAVSDLIAKYQHMRLTQQEQQ